MRSPIKHRKWGQKFKNASLPVLCMSFHRAIDEYKRVLWRKDIASIKTHCQRRFKFQKRYEKWSFILLYNYVKLNKNLNEQNYIRDLRNVTCLSEKWTGELRESEHRIYAQFTAPAVNWAYIRAQFTSAIFEAQIRIFDNFPDLKSFLNRGNLVFCGVWD